MAMRKIIQVEWREVVENRVDTADDEEIVEVDAVEQHGQMVLVGVWVMRVIHRYDDTGIPPPTPETAP